MYLSKADILQAAMVGLTLVLSAVAIPVIASGQTAQNIQQPAQQSIDNLCI